MSKPFEPFEVFEVKLLKKLRTDAGTLKPGQTAYACYNPANHIYLSDQGVPGARRIGRVAESNAQKGVHFEVSPEVEARMWKEPQFEAAEEPGQMPYWRPRTKP